MFKAVRLSGWALLPIMAGFLVTGYAIAGQPGFARLCDEKTALAFHRMLHWPLIVLALVHSLPAVYLAFQRWGWIKHREES
jgi:succinate dehydrogenase/fumarate reductase cytochrome b subunit